MGAAYLSRAFFVRLGETLPDRVLLVMAETPAGDLVAGALNLMGAGRALRALLGAASTPRRFLHFEACYYQAIDFAIAPEMARVQAGAQGEHKLPRGYRPEPTWSAHWIGACGPAPRGPAVFGGGTPCGSKRKCTNWRPRHRSARTSDLK